MLLRNAMRTPDGTIIESKHRHDYVTHDDDNGEQYMVDGGTSYLKRSVNAVSAEDLSINSRPDDHEFNRQHFKWGTYGKNGSQPLRHVALMDMDMEHLEAIMITQNLSDNVGKLFIEEIKYRAENK